MNDRRENSVLFALKELRRIEDTRVQKEQDEARARADAERAAKEAAEQAARDEAERMRLEIERARRAEEQAREDKTREEQLRLQESERRHRVDAEMRMNEERMRLEIQHRAKQSPVKAMVSVALVLVVIGGGIGYKMYSQHQTELAAKQAEIARVEAQRARIQAEKDKAETEYRSQMAKLQKEMDDKLARARTAEERERIKLEYAQQRAQANANRGKHGSGPKGDSPAPTKYKAPGKHEISDNPLEGLSGL
jgi:hypothetical protein